MYIVKFSEDKKKDLYSILPNIKDHYEEVDSFEEALSLRKKMIEKYPFLVKVEIFKSEKIEIKDNIQEEAREKLNSYYEKVMYYKALGFNGYKELDNDGKVIFEF